MKKTLTLALIAPFLGCCSMDDSIGDMLDTPESCTRIAFTPMEFRATNDATRASQTQKASITSFGVSCAIYPSTSTYSNAECGSYFFNETVDAASGRTEYLWPGKKYNLSFYAFAPCDNPAIGIVSQKTDLGKPVYRYTMPSDLSRQADFMTCDVIDQIGTSTEPITLEFAHRCADVRFKIHNRSDKLLIIKSIGIYGVKYKGMFNGSDWDLDTDVNSPSENPFELSLDTEIAPGDTFDATGKDNHFILLPQTIRWDVGAFVFKTIEDGAEKTYTYKRGNGLFLLNAGLSFIFTVSLGDNQIIVDPNTTIEDWKPEIKYLSIADVNTNFFAATGVNNGFVNDPSDWQEGENEYVGLPMTVEASIINGTVEQESETKWCLRGMETANYISTVRLTFAGVRKVTLIVKSDGESSYDYCSWGAADTPCRSRDGGIGKTSGRQQQDIEIVYDFADDGEHFIEVNYAKDGSVNGYSDRGWVEIVSME